MSRQEKNGRTVKDVILALVREALFGIPAGQIDQVDWDVVLRECKAQHVVALVYAGVRRQKMPKETAARWEQTMNKMLHYNVLSQRKHLEIYRLMEHAGLPCVIIKGIASAAYYPKPILRGAGDVDFLVHKADLQRGDQLLCSIGLHQLEGAQEHESHLAYHKRGYHVEMHWRINGVPTGENGACISDQLEDLIEASEEYSCESGICRIPAKRHHAMILLVHTASHLMSSGTSIRHLCDWAVFVASAGEAFFEKEMQGTLKRVGLWRMAQILTDLSTEYLGLPAQSWAGVTEADYLRHMFDDFYASGYFGRKDPARAYQGVWYLQRDTKRVSEGNMLRNFIRHMNRVVYANLPFTERMPFLLPVGWCYIGGRYLVRVKRGKRSMIRFGSWKKSAQDRRDLYQVWRLFEPERQDGAS